ncbi:hypothetical protein Tco_0193187, partial [Tanacetum coccineum]
NLVPIPSESEDFSDNESKCDVPECDESSPTFTTFSNPLFDSNDDFTSRDDESLSDEDVPMENFKIYSNPLFDDEEIGSRGDIGSMGVCFPTVIHTGKSAAKSVCFPTVIHTHIYMSKGGYRIKGCLFFGLVLACKSAARLQNDPPEPADATTHLTRLNDFGLQIQSNQLLCAHG